MTTGKTNHVGQRMLVSVIWFLGTAIISQAYPFAWWIGCGSLLVFWIVWSIYYKPPIFYRGQRVLYGLICFVAALELSHFFPIPWWVCCVVFLIWFAWLMHEHPETVTRDCKAIGKIVGDCLDSWRMPIFPLAAYIISVELTWLFDWFYIRPEGYQVKASDFLWTRPDQDTTVAVKELTARLINEAVDILKLLVSIAALCFMLSVIVRESSLKKVRPLFWFAVIAFVVYLTLEWGLMPKLRVETGLPFSLDDFASGNDSPSHPFASLETSALWPHETNVETG